MRRRSHTPGEIGREDVGEVGGGAVIHCQIYRVLPIVTPRGVLVHKIEKRRETVVDAGIGRRRSRFAVNYVRQDLPGAGSRDGTSAELPPQHHECRYYRTALICDFFLNLLPPVSPIVEEITV